MKNNFIFLFEDNSLNYDCFNCFDTCCNRHTFIPIGNSFKDSYQQNFSINNSMVLLNNCIYLKNNKCLIEIEQGKQFKPNACNIFPYAISKNNENYIISLLYSECYITESKNGNISKKHFFEQIEGINIDKILSYIENIDIFAKNETVKTIDYLNFGDNYKYLDMWNKYFNENIEIKENNWWVKTFNYEFIDINYFNFSIIEKYALIYLVNLYKKTTTKDIFSKDILKIAKVFKNTIKIMALFNETNIINNKINQNNLFFNELIDLYLLNKKYSLFQSLLKIEIKEKGNFLNSIIHL